MPVPTKRRTTKYVKVDHKGKQQHPNNNPTLGDIVAAHDLVYMKDGIWHRKKPQATHFV